MGFNMVATNHDGTTLMGWMKRLHQDDIDKEFTIAEQRYTIALLEVQVARLTDTVNELHGMLHALRMDTQ
jgi:uncharacterized coiled-coil protein SlyX